MSTAQVTSDPPSSAFPDPEVARPDAPAAGAPRLLMCPPSHFEVSYAINPWMHPDQPVDQALALAQWEQLRRCYTGLGWQVELIDPAAGLPDMVFAANGGFTLDGVAYGARFSHVQREAEAPLYLSRLTELGFTPHPAAQLNEGEGDFLVSGELILAGYGFRSSLESHAELAALTGRQVVSLRLVDPRYYHLDTALAVIGPTIAYLPEAFDVDSRIRLAELFPDAVMAHADEAAALGLNLLCLGSQVVVGDGTPSLSARLTDLGFQVHSVQTTELRKAGGSLKCCTLLLRP